MTTPEDPSIDDLQQQGRALRAIARSILRGADGADDVVQEAFATGLAARHRVANRGGWLTRIVQNLARRRLRDLARRRQRHAALDPATPLPSPDDVLAQIETHRRVADAVLHLGEPHRRAIVLRYWHDLPPRAIARQLGVPVATVKTHLQRGIAELRRRLESEHAKDGDANNRGAWLAALVPIAHPRLVATTGAPIGLATLTTILAMNTKQFAFAGAAVVCLSVLAWPMLAPTTSDSTPALPAGLAASKGGHEVNAAAEGIADARAVATTAADSAPDRRTAAASNDPTCTVVGRILAPGGGPALHARIRLVNGVESDVAPAIAAAAAADGTFAVSVRLRHDWIWYQFALADAKDLAVRQLELSRPDNPIVDGRLDLGTFQLERGVAVSGRVVEADGSPLRTRARLLAWDPAGIGSQTSMYAGLTVGFAEPGGTFTLADRFAAAPGGKWQLAAVAESGVGWATLAFAAGQERLDPVEIRLLRGGGVRAHVVDANGKPLADATVTATPYFTPIGLAPMWEPRWSQRAAPRFAEVTALFVRRSDSRGEARFANLPRRHDPRVRDANENQRVVPAIIVGAQLPGFIPNCATIEPQLDGEADVTIALLRERRVAFHGKVATADGVGRGGVTVGPNGGEARVVTDAQGHYELPEDTYGSDSVSFVLEGGVVPRTFLDVDVPTVGDRVEHDFTVEARAPVIGRVVDQDGRPVAGARLHLGVAQGGHFASTPEQTAADGVFAFPDAVASHTDLWVQPPDPATAWRQELPRALSRRDGEVVTLQRLDGPLVDLELAIVDGITDAALSPTDVELEPLLANSVSYDVTWPRSTTLALGLAIVRQVRPGRYRASVHGAGGRSARRDIVVPGDAATHRERIALHATSTVVCTVDTSALANEELARLGGETGLVLLDPRCKSQAVDAKGNRLAYTPDCGAFRFGIDSEFRLADVTTDATQRLVLLGKDELFGEAWFRPEPGAETHVTLRLQPAGHVAWQLPIGWSPDAVEIDAADGADWRPLRTSGPLTEDSADSDAASAAIDARGQSTRIPQGAILAKCPAGPLSWRARHWPSHDSEPVERRGSVEVRRGVTTVVAVE